MTSPAPIVDVGHEVSWAAVADRLRPYVRRHVGSEADADDVLQEVLLKMHGRLPTLRDEERLVPWAFGIARRAVADHHRARGRAPIPTEEIVDPQRPSSLDDRHDIDALTMTLATFVAALPSPYREAIVLTELEGRTQREAAGMIGVSLTAMKSRVQRGRAKLRQMLERCCAIELDARNRIVHVQPRPDGELPDGCCDSGCAPTPSADAKPA